MCPGFYGEGRADGTSGVIDGLDRADAISNAIFSKVLPPPAPPPHPLRRMRRRRRMGTARTARPLALLRLAPPGVSTTV